ncbi:hypothetical protein ACERIT_15830 [Halopenitus sp. H-Gu1]|uniref:DUF7539 family protein n=1 Tax=Halopenitus sp. H-Gu1 TaxID=3242697 RepID=UPI00359ED877
MAEFETERELLSVVRDHVDEWVSEARTEAFEELFEGPDTNVSEGELQLLDRLDSRLSREEGQGLWDADEYAIVQTGTLDEESTPRVVCTTHPEIPERAYPGEEAFDAATRATLNETLWKYCQRVVELTQQRLDEFVWSADVATWNE